MATAKGHEEILVGAHTSIAGGVHNALLEGKRIGATTIQMFTANQRRWLSKIFEDESIRLWKKTLEETGLKKIMSHDSYLINLGAADPVILQKSRQGFKEEIIRCQQLDLAFLNFHPGAAVNCEAHDCLDRICDSLLEHEKLLANSSLRLLLETTAGQGSVVGWKFEELAYIIEKVKKRIPIGVCIDTCHIFVAGYDIRTPQALDATLKEFDQVIGLKHLYAFHLNDSLKGLGSRVDRHKNLGEGEIGIDCFKFLMQDQRTRHLPKYLETPETSRWEHEIALLKKFAD